MKGEAEGLILAARSSTPRAEIAHAFDAANLKGGPE